MEWILLPKDLPYVDEPSTFIERNTYFLSLSLSLSLSQLGWNRITRYLSLTILFSKWMTHSPPFPGIRISNQLDRTFHLRLSSWLQLFLKKMANPGLFFIYFRLFKHEFTIFTTNKCEKCSFSIQYRDLNSRHLEHESPPITSRPRFPPRITLVCGVRTSGSWTQTHPPILLKLWYMGTRKTRIDL